MSDEQGYPAGCAKCRDLKMQVRVYKREAVEHWERSKALAEALRGLFDEVTKEYGAQPTVPAWVKAFETLEQTK